VNRKTQGYLGSGRALYLMRHNNNPTQLDDIFALIDAMPMRQQEMP
jgi:hypothetical protein